MYANILIVDKPGNYERVFTYSIPAGMKVQSGAMVLVPVRRQYCQGLVLSLQEKQPDFIHDKERPEIKEIKQVFEGLTGVTPLAIQLAQWIADYYVCSLSKVMELFLPPPVRLKEELVYLINSSAFGKAEEMLLPEQERRILALLREKTTDGDGLSALEIRRRLGRPVERELSNLADSHFLTVKKVYLPEVTEKEETVFAVREEKCPAPDIEQMLQRAPRQREIFQALLEKPTSVTELKAKGLYHRPALNALIAKELIVAFAKEVERKPYTIKPVSERPASLNQAQKEACEALCASLTAGGGKWLLHGVTGSGKTEVYLHVMTEALARGRQVLYLVPEIALTSQVVAILIAAFGEDVAILHSALSPGERYDQWRKIREGRARVVIGPRSAVFAPFSRLGLIIIDEEHEHTYKQNEPDPRYDARTVAEKLADLTGAVLVRGSATPALRTYYATYSGEYRLLQLAERVASRPLPEIEIVDMCKERQQGTSGIFSSKMLTALQDTLAAGEQAILFLNRRGFHTYVMCRECGKPLVCPRCNITLNYHRTKGELVCHYCNYVRSLPRNCSSCGSTFVRYYGTGTERVAEEFVRYFPAVPFVRMDTDTTQKKDSHTKMLEAVQKGQAKVLIGTQMIAKGLDFPQVTLVGILNPDLLLNMPDYQAAERAYQLMTQVAGRAGRGEEPGKVLIQTYQPDNYLFTSVIRQNYGEFYRQEMANRQMLQYPPFAYLARILVSGYHEQQVKQRIQLWAELIKAELKKSEALPADGNVEILGPGPAPLELLKKRFRYHIIIKSTELPVVQKLAGHIREKALEFSGEVRTVIDIEPQSLL